MTDERQAPAARTGGEWAWSRAWLVLGLGAALGLAVGLILGALGGGGYSAATLVDGGPGGTVNALDISTDAANRYVQTELIYIEILQPKFRESIQAAGLPDPGKDPVASSQVALTNVVRLSAEGATKEDSVQASRIAAEVYAQDWKARTSQDLDGRRQNVTEQISNIRSQLSSLDTTPADLPERRGLSKQLTRLVQERESIATSLGEVAAVDRLVQESTPALAVRQLLSLPLGGAGMLLGLLVATGILIRHRSRVRQ